MIPSRGHSYSFSLRTLFSAVTMTAVACWLVYQLNWIRDRQIAREWLRQHRAPVMFPRAPSVNGLAPWPLPAFGETPLTPDSAVFVRPLKPDRFDPSEYQRQVDRIRRLFPESEIDDSWRELAKSLEE
jgi:hypothetical protein